LLLEDISYEKAEIVKTSSATGPSGSTITLNSGLLFTHPQDTKVTIIDWDRIDIQWSATASGAKSTIMAYPIYIQPQLVETIYNDTTKTTGYYFVRFNETVANTYSDWSDPIPYAGFGANTVAMIKKRAIDSINERIDPNLVTHDFLNESLWEARREYHSSPGKRPFRKHYNYAMGSVSTGMYRIEAPSDLENPYTGENIFGMRIGTEDNMMWFDKKDWDAAFRGVSHTVLTTAYTVGDKDLYCDNVRDFESSGSVDIENDSSAYSAIGVSGGTMRISTAGSANHATGKDVWQGVSYSLPNRFTVWGEPVANETVGSIYIYFSCPIETSYVNQNIWIDYYSGLPEYDSDADELDEPQYDMFTNYLAFKIKQRKNKGLNQLTDTDFLLWTQKKKAALDNEYLGTEIRIFPGIEHLP